MNEFFNTVWDIWTAGGILMIPLAVIGLLIYFAIFELMYYLAGHNYFHSDQNEWGHWVDIPADAHGEIGKIIQYSQDGVRNVHDVRKRFEELRAAHLPRVSRRVLYITILIGVAPITGLLGTVMGMLNTFVGLSVSSGGKTVDLVAGGISEALITTQTGLVFAIPAYVLISILRRQSGELEMFFTRLEILTIQKFERIHQNMRKQAV